MGLSEKPHHHMERDDAEAKIWVIAGISLKGPLKPLSLTKTPDNTKETEKKDEEEECFLTPRAEEARIPSILKCPSAPRKKRKQSSKCHYNGVSVTSTVREFFTPPDLETVFEFRGEKV